MKDSSGTMRLAGVDIGTLTCRLLIADLPPGGRLKEVRSERRILRLGEGVDQTKRLSIVAMDRVLRCLREWREMIDASQVDAAVAVATSAVRDAANRDEFLDRVKREAGFEVEIITGEEEARRTMLGIRSGLPPGVTDVLALDIGGGSTEFVLARDGAPAAAVSLRLGVVTLQEEWGEPGPVRWDRFARLHEHVERRLAAEVPEAIAGAAVAELVGTAGTVTTLAALDLGLRAYDAAVVHGHRLDRAAVERQLARLGALDVEARGLLPCLEPGRADVIIPGIAICLAAMARLRRETVVVSDRGLREGILCELLGTAA